MSTQSTVRASRSARRRAIAEGAARADPACLRLPVQRRPDTKVPVLRVAIACVLLGVACTSRVDDPPGPAYDSWDEACTIWEWIASRTMEATDEVAIAQLVTELRAKCDFYEHVAPAECTEVVWDLLACQEPLPRRLQELQRLLLRRGSQPQPSSQPER